MTRHEYLKSKGHSRHYGAAIPSTVTSEFSRERVGLIAYTQLLMERYPALANSEPDLYVAFTELFGRLCNSAGTLAAIVPAGLIRSQGTESIRRGLFDSFDRVSLSVIENRGRFFSIDSRFKFLTVVCSRVASASGGARKPIVLMHEKGAEREMVISGLARISRDSLKAVRPDLSLPEVRSSVEWQLFRKMSVTGVSWNDPRHCWRPHFCREVDMTRDRRKFTSHQGPNSLPLVEGRMIHQFRIGAKKFMSGTGRRAIWRALPLGAAQIAPQFYIRASKLSPEAQRRSMATRVGFCDITGQTNERTMMAAVVPSGVVCGNKVPTVMFPDDPSEERLYAWCAVVNSLPFDWMLRRVMTTTVNYFLLVSVPMPGIKRDGLPWRRIVAAAKELHQLDNNRVSQHSLQRAATLRAEIDVEIAVAYGLDLRELAIVLHDFPALDRGQPALEGESRSTVTRDLVMTTAAQRMRKVPGLWASRLADAKLKGAIAYVPAQVVVQSREGSGSQVFEFN